MRTYPFQLFLSVGSDEKSTLNVWDIKRAKVIAQASETTEKVFDAQFHPDWTPSGADRTSSGVSIVTCGLKSIAFWRMYGNVLSRHPGDFGSTTEPETVLCLTFGDGGITFAGTLAGNILLWRECQLEGAIENAHVVN